MPTTVALLVIANVCTYAIAIYRIAGLVWR